eukprot:7893871-Pyramimonas_sp.AAC.1
MNLHLHEHDLVKVGGRLFCRKCKKTARTPEARRQLAGGTDRWCRPAAIHTLQARVLEAAAVNR